MNQKIEACIVFCSDDGANVFVGNGEDFLNDRKVEIWFKKTEEKKYGRLFWGFNYNIIPVKWIPQGGMNDQGLFIDGTAVNEVEILKDNNKKNKYFNITEMVLSQCSTVEEALQLLSNYNLIHYNKCQIFIADKTGDYAIIESNFISRKSDNNYSVLTNFRFSNPEETGYPCKRYDKASSLLETNDEASYHNFEKVLKSVQKSGPRYSTIYSTIGDLKNGKIQFYQFHDYENPILIDLEKELEKGNHKYFLADLFPRRISTQLFDTNNKHGFNSAYNQLLDFINNKNENICESELIQFSQNLIRNNQKEEALKILAFTSGIYPDSEIVLWETGLTNYKNGENQKAIEYFKKYLAINPLDEKCVKIVHQLENPLKKANTSFRLSGFENASYVTIKMDTEGWEDYHHIMYKDGNDWVYNIDLENKRYKYAFKIDGIWTLDPGNPNQIEDYDGVMVSVLENR